VLNVRVVATWALAGGAVLALAGCGVNREAAGTVTVTVADSAPSTQPAPQADDSPTGAAPAQPSTTVAAAAPTRTQTPARAPSSSNAEAGDWQLIAETRRSAGTDTGRQSELLQERLTSLSPQAIVDFARFRHRLDERLYTWTIWGAASVIEDGCSDDCFRDFRAYVISLGPGPYEAALRNPDSLASVAQNAEQGDWENADNVAPDAYSSVTGNDFPLDDSDLSGRPRGTPINLDNTAALVRRYPRLAARFR
jgi:hypothetical protein